MAIKRLSRGIWRVFRWQGETDGYEIQRAFLQTQTVESVRCEAPVPVYFIVASFTYQRAPNARVLRYVPAEPYWAWVHLGTVKSKAMCRELGLPLCGKGPWNALLRTILVDKHLTEQRDIMRARIAQESFM